ncbi:hypothetical protein GCM10010987_63770 [Bradyrhizobium guangdongense]|uniref:Uncharacterized protein n=1 Tax=Bradyrhizobium guangdongense TaxID=1325090 RepID=A0AA88BBR2_9BRAD|nr:hypothetical protein GCM10010987_63770 [Bradyrhizobium guangdongense]
MAIGNEPLDHGPVRQLHTSVEVRLGKAICYQSRHQARKQSVGSFDHSWLDAALCGGRRDFEADKSATNDGHSV